MTAETQTVETEILKPQFRVRRLQRFDPEEVRS